MSRIDIALDENFDLLEEDNEWIEDESEDIDVQLILLTNKGENKEFPFCGWGANKKLKGKFDKIKIQREIEIELGLDGFNPIVEIGETLSDLKITV